MAFSDSDINISKKLSWLLRHGALKEGLHIHPDGFVSVDELLRHKSFKFVTAEDIKRVVANNLKQRFTLRTIDGVLAVRANQGHSIKEIDDLELTPILDANGVRIIHGTYLKNWSSIKAHGLSRMNRVHIHFAPGLPTENVTSGVRANAEVFIYVNVKKALESGLKFFRAANGVILSPGNADGVIESGLFEKVCLSDGTELSL